MIGTVAAFGLVSAQVFAETSYETAQVTESRAIYEVVEISTPQEQCWEEETVVERRGSDNRSNTPVLVSTILGGAIGNAVARGAGHTPHPAQAHQEAGHTGPEL